MSALLQVQQQQIKYLFSFVVHINFMEVRGSTDDETSYVLEKLNEEQFEDIDCPLDCILILIRHIYGLLFQVVRWVAPKPRTILDTRSH